MGAWIENPEGKVMAGKMPALHRAGGPAEENYSWQGLKLRTQWRDCCEACDKCLSAAIAGQLN